MTDPSPPPRMLSAPLRLTAMTLRGRGPYLHGARLEIKPLTILCGENGSGKSIWIDMMHYLWGALSPRSGDDQRSDDERFPWRGMLYPSDGADAKAAVAPIDRRNLHSAIVTAAKDAESIREARERLFHPDDDDKFGPAGTLGFEIEAMNDDDGNPPSDMPNELPGTGSTSPEQFLRNCTMKRGDKLRIRWCQLREDIIHGGQGYEIPELPGLTELLELTLNGRHVIRLQHRYGMGEEEDAAKWNEKGIYFTLECSPTFWGETEPEPMTLGMLDLSNQSAEPDSDGLFSGPTIRKLYEMFDNVTHKILRQVVVKQYFPVGPIRMTHIATKSFTSRPTESQRKWREFFAKNEWGVSGIRRGQDESLDEYRDRMQEEKAEYELKAVIRASGKESNSAQPAYESSDRQPIDNRSYEYHLISFLEEKRQRLPDGDLLEEGFEESFGERKYNGTYRYVGENGQHAQELWKRFAYRLMREPNSSFTGEIDNRFEADDFVDGVVDGIANLPEDVRDRMLEVCDPQLRDEWINNIKRRTAYESLALKLLNDLLSRRNLFEKSVWPQVTVEAHHMLGDDGCNLASMSNDEVIRLNRLLLEDAFAHNDQRFCRHRTGYLFETYLSYWMKDLTGANMQYDEFEGSALPELWSNSSRPPSGGLTEVKQFIPHGEDFRLVEPDGSKDDFEQVVRPATAIAKTSWRTMSTGFHQLAPIVVQAGLLRQNEIMAVENPEAHLHPSLQIKVAEFLMHQANAGKFLLIETHSDLVVRRVLRAIREEQVSPGNVFKQSSVGINFTSLVPDPQGFKHAKIEELAINDQGQIGNWPDGFMDDDLKEANNWLAAMERQRSLDDEE